jgi:hypothetical protein
MVMRYTKRRRVQWQSAAARRLLAIAGNPSTVREAVEIVVAKFLENIDYPPTNLEAIQARLNVNQVETEDLPFSGELRRGGTVSRSSCRSTCPRVDDVSRSHTNSGTPFLKEQGRAVRALVQSLSGCVTC